MEPLPDHVDRQKFLSVGFWMKKKWDLFEPVRACVEKNI
jgi:hypothetical protein